MFIYKGHYRPDCRLKQEPSESLQEIKILQKKIKTVPNVMEAVLNLYNQSTLGKPVGVLGIGRTSANR